MLKKGLDVLLIMGLLFLSSLPLALSAVMSELKVNPVVILGVGVSLSVLVIGIYLFVGYRKDLLTRSFKTWYSSRSLGVSLLGFVAMIAISMVSSYILSLEGADTTVNQATIELMIAQLPKVITFLAIVIIAPLGEEVVCRGLIPNLFSAKTQILGHLLGTLIFAYLHTPTNIGSWLTYGGMGAVLAIVRYRTKHLEYSILTHGLNNMIGFLSILFA